MNKFITTLALVLFDIIAILFSIFVAVSFRQILNWFIDAPIIGYEYVRFFAVYVTLLLILAYFGIYTKRFDFWHESLLIVKASILSFALLLAGLVMSQNAEYYSRSTLILIFFFICIILPISKFIVKKILFRCGIWRKPAKVITNNETFSSELFDNFYLGYVKAEHSEHKILFIDSLNLDKDKLNTIIEKNINHNREIIFTPVLREYDFSQSYIYNLFNSRINIFTLENKLLSKTNRIVKTIFDYILVIVSMPFWLLLLIVIAFLIKKEDPKGKIFFKQKRLGLNGKEFICYKFRSMYSDQSFMEQWLKDNPDEKAYYEQYHKYINDPRITKIGEFLRKTSLDEIPQLINVLIGNMSLIGPRPYMVEEKSDIGQKAPLVLGVKPGITGLWQVSGRSEIDFDSRVEIDVWYMKNWSLWNDIVILFKTVNVVLKRDGAY
ncbi:exopolysaccharide biosynthesis polyprenyl glycosylphosphotransferase [Lonepinella koalarum]|uniref:exopolysaccharide biosynthesis polyprenyl glycosylphosphotransferase n=1 Tax=Lonepinella koalarum TaxID=53417 RepID=UPI003F6DD983